MWLTVALLIPLAAAHAVLPWYTRRGTREDEQDTPLPGDDLVPDPKTGYTMAVTIDAPPSAIWPWLVQMGQGRGGFYTHEWVENLLGADIRNANCVVSEWQQLEVGEQVRLTPNPFFGQPGQFMTVAEIQPERALVFRQTLPNGSPASWAFLLMSEDKRTTRVLMRRRGGDPTLFDRVMAPGYSFMDRGVLHGLRRRAEGLALLEPSPSTGPQSTESTRAQATPLMLANRPAGLFSTSAAVPTIAAMPIRTPAQPSQDENVPAAGDRIAPPQVTRDQIAEVPSAARSCSHNPAKNGT
jgi:hypothetical protein